MNTAIVTTTAATVSPFIQNLQQQQQQKPQTSKEAIAANVKALIEQLEEGHSESLTAYLMAMGRFHNYSFGNILEIARQKPSATRVAGMYAWNQLGRRVNKGEKGIRILAPMTGVRRKVAGGYRSQDALHRTRKSVGERILRKLQREAAR